MMALFRSQIIHNDIKPENVGLSMNHSFLISNFEKAIKAEDCFIEYNSVIHVGEFTAPEIIALSSSDSSKKIPFIDVFASDIYSLGAMIKKLYQENEKLLEEANIVK